MKITVEVVDMAGMTPAEFDDAVDAEASGVLDLPGWMAALDVKIVGYEGDGSNGK